MKDQRVETGKITWKRLHCLFEEFDDFVDSDSDYYYRLHLLVMISTLTADLDCYQVDLLK